MLNLKIGEKDYTLEYSFMAAEHKDTIQKMFNVLSGAYLIKKANVSENMEIQTEGMAVVMLEGTAEMVSEIPHIVKTTFYSGLLENHNVSEEEAYELMKQYMKENKYGYRKLFEDIKVCMENDGFFDLSGLTEMLADLNPEEKPKKAPKKPQDHQKKSTGTK